MCPSIARLARGFERLRVNLYCPIGRPHDRTRSDGCGPQYLTHRSVAAVCRPVASYVRAPHSLWQRPAAKLVPGVCFFALFASRGRIAKESHTRCKLCVRFCVNHRSDRGVFCLHCPSWFTLAENPLEVGVTRDLALPEQLQDHHRPACTVGRMRYGL